MAQTPHTEKVTAGKKPASGKELMKGAADNQIMDNMVMEERNRMIAEEAYRIAERRGFQGDMALDDWLKAEASINSQSEAKH